MTGAFFMRLGVYFADQREVSIYTGRRSIPTGFTPTAKAAAILPFQNRGIDDTSGAGLDRLRSGREEQEREEKCEE